MLFNSLFFSFAYDWRAQGVRARGNWNHLLTSDGGRPICTDTQIVWFSWFKNLSSHTKWIAFQSMGGESVLSTKRFAKNISHKKCVNHRKYMQVLRWHKLYSHFVQVRNNIGLKDMSLTLNSSSRSVFRVKSIIAKKISESWPWRKSCRKTMKYRQVEPGFNEVAQQSSYHCNTWLFVFTSVWVSLEPITALCVM
jgi:hypothetical protein